MLHLGPGLGNGLANLHNARRARTPIVNVVGDHATYHRRYDAPLDSDIEAVAGSKAGSAGPSTRRTSAPTPPRRSRPPRTPPGASRRCSSRPTRPGARAARPPLPSRRAAPGPLTRPPCGTSPLC
ncbi:thiamine pyrophosphate-binding protein [Actinomadura madurae]|nr:thiamine pyrophosphate-binding protein [Actinomadura madurae]MCP9968482.1 thiamine pyrophosphate-binding protein [Actinomadura madurae]